ncbi:MAG: hypothetical protein GEU73_01730 [Chloroflexi bacterium]|nr:hypothetical protein [Chloroflexota bacterium]
MRPGASWARQSRTSRRTWIRCWTWTYGDSSAWRKDSSRKQSSAGLARLSTTEHVASPSMIRAYNVRRNILGSEQEIIAWRRAGGGVRGVREAGRMPTAIDRNDLRELARSGAQLIEVLPRQEYDDEHLPGAINMPLTRMDGESGAEFRRDVPVVVYCQDYQ